MNWFKSLLFALVVTLIAPAVAAEPAVKIMNFTADWCPNCLVLNPRLDEAMLGFDAEDAVVVPVDMTDLRGKGETVKWETVDRLKAQLLEHEARYLWDWYGGFTGLAIIIAADNGEPLTCLSRRPTAEQMAALIQESIVLAKKAPPGRRRPQGPDCPPPMRPQ